MVAGWVDLGLHRRSRWGRGHLHDGRAGRYPPAADLENRSGQQSGLVARRPDHRVRRLHRRTAQGFTSQTRQEKLALPRIRVTGFTADLVARRSAHRLPRRPGRRSLHRSRVVARGERRVEGAGVGPGASPRVVARRQRHRFLDAAHGWVDRGGTAARGSQLPIRLSPLRSGRARPDRVVTGRQVPGHLRLACRRRP